MQEGQAATWRRTRQGEWVVCGRTDEVVAGSDALVRRSNGSLQWVHIETTGRPFRVDGQQMVYGYVRRRVPAGAAVSTYDCGHRIDRPVRGCFHCEHQIGL